MDDSRLTVYRRALSDMVKGEYPQALPVSDDDEVGRLGSALLGLSRTLEHRFAEQQLLYQITAQANASLLVDEILDQLYASFRDLIPYHRIGLALLEDEGRTLRARWARSDAQCIYLKGGFSACMEGSSLQTILETGQPRILNDLEDYLQAHPDSKSTALVVTEGVRSSLTCPLVAIGKAVGFLFFSSFEKNTYRNAHVNLFMQIANQLASIVEKSRLYEELQRVNTELRQAQDRLEFLASHDALTGLKNRRTLNECLQSEWDRAIRARTPISAIMIDVDSFKLYNDFHGHLAGDECLQAVARVVAEGARRPADHSARYGGEEFVVLLPETDADGVLNRAEHIRAGVEALRFPHGQSIASAVVTISAGTATIIPAPDSSPSTLLSTADNALYHAKKSGRNQVVTDDALAVTCMA
jgi:diguanylate cyclase (GGDEF)-like protein